MSTVSTGFDQEAMEGLAAAQNEQTGAEVSEEMLIEAEAPAVVSADHRQLKQLAKLQQNAVDHSIFETKKFNEGEKIRFTTTFDEVTLFNSINSSSESVADHFNEDITVENIVITTAQVNMDINDDFSEKEDKPCVHFFCKDGLHLASVSNGIIRSAENLITCSIIPSPEAPIVIKFKEITTKKGKAHSFDLVSR
ncbi:MAG: hypothetical protein J5723_02570 [Ruminococcus sp.]|nr:hypothetical protein [Ruminococcus sp.]